jgi:hypothetical protein
MRSHKIPNEFENAPTEVSIPTPLEDEDTRPGWFCKRNPALALAPRDRMMLRNLISYVGTVPQGQRPGAVARALRQVLRHYANPVDLRESVLAFLQDEAVRLDARDGGRS